MSITYDPMTGEPIETEDETVDTTETPVNNEVTENVEVAEVSDNNNEENTVSEAQNVEADASNTEEVNVPAAETQSDFKMNFDPLTGKPITNAVDTPAPSEKKKINPAVIIGIAAALVIVLIVAVVCATGVFSKQKKIEKACIATFNFETQLTKDLKPIVDILQNGSYTYNVSVDAGSEGSVNASLICDNNDKQISFNADIDDMEISALAGIDSKTVKAEAPDICSKLFVYNYKDEKNGAITDFLDDDELKLIDTGLETIYDTKKAAESDLKNAAELQKIWNNHVKELEFESADKEEFKINGKKVSCEGITTSVDSDFIVDFWDDLTDFYVEQFDEEYSDIMDMADVDIEDSFKEIRDELKSMPDFDLIFYIYKGQLAAIVLDGGKKGGEIAIKFEGGDFRAQNISIDVNDETCMELKGSSKDGKETYKVSVDDGSEFIVTYNKSKNKLEIEYNDEYSYDSFDIVFNCEITNSSLKLSVDDIDEYVDDIEEISIELTKGAKLLKYENDDEFDLGNADEDDFEDLIDSIDEDYLYSLSYLF